MRTKKIEWDILERFRDAAINLQKTYQEQQHIRRFNQATRNYYRKQKDKALLEFSKYEFLYSEHYRRLREDGPSDNIPFIFNQEITNLIRSGTSYQETYQAITQVFDRKIREATKNPPVDPDLGKADKTAIKYQADIEKLMKTYVNRIIDLTREGKSVNEIIIETEAMKPSLILEIEDTVTDRITAAVDAGGMVAGAYIDNLIKNRG